jgi:phosphoserine aminotransferase
VIDNLDRRVVKGMGKFVQIRWDHPMNAFCKWRFPIVVPYGFRYLYEISERLASKNNWNKVRNTPPISVTLVKYTYFLDRTWPKCSGGVDGIEENNEPNCSL